MLQLKTNFNWRRPLIEEDIKISEVEYLSNQWSDITQILNLTSQIWNLSSGDQTELENASIEDEL